jgi:DNA-binding IclR family transcriptional regulator
VHDHTGHPIAGVAVTFATDAVPPDERARLRSAVSACALELTRRIGGTPPAREVRLGSAP